MVGLERSVLPLVGEEEFGLESRVAILSFVVAFGVAKAFTNLGAGVLADRVGRKRLLVIGWLVALPVPAMIALAPSWGWIVAANVLLGINQGFAWSMTVVMKIDLAGPARRGLALGLNEAAGYLGVAVTAFLTGALAATYAPQTVIWVGAVVIVLTGLIVSYLLRAGHGCARRPRAARSRPGRAGDLAAAGAHPRDVPATGAPCVLPGRAREQPQRRPRLGPRAAVPRGERREHPRDRNRCSRLSGALGCRPARHRLALRSHRAEAVDRARHARAVCVVWPSSFWAAGPSRPPSAAAALLGVGTALVYPTLIAAVSDAVAAAGIALRPSASIASGAMPASLSVRCSPVSSPMRRARARRSRSSPALTAASGLVRRRDALAGNERSAYSRRRTRRAGSHRSRCVICLTARCAYPQGYLLSIVRMS